MSNPSDQLNDEQTESSFEQPENEPEVKGKTGFKSLVSLAAKYPQGQTRLRESSWQWSFPMIPCMCEQRETSPIFYSSIHCARSTDSRLLHLALELSIASTCEC